MIGNKSIIDSLIQEIYYTLVLQGLFKSVFNCNRQYHVWFLSSYQIPPSLWIGDTVVLSD